MRLEDGAELTHSDLEALGMRCVSDEALREFYDALAIDEASGEVGTAILAARLTDAPAGPTFFAPCPLLAGATWCGDCLCRQVERRVGRTLLDLTLFVT